MQPKAVIDTNVVVSAIGWRGEARGVFRLLLSRSFDSIRSPYLTTEWAETLARLASQPGWENRNWQGWLEWLKGRSRLVNDPPSKTIVRRDLKDNPVLALAIGQQAKFLVTFDKDLLTLEKPYGVHCLPPRSFIRTILTIP